MAIWNRNKKPSVVRDQGGRISLHYAAGDTGGDKQDVAAQLISEGQDPNDRDLHGVTPLHLAAQYDGVETVRVLLDAGADPNIADDAGDTALHYALNSPWKSAPVVRLLREHGADPLRENLKGYTALSYIADVTNKPDIRAVFADLLDEQTGAP